MFNAMHGAARLWGGGGCTCRELCPSLADNESSHRHRKLSKCCLSCVVVNRPRAAVAVAALHCAAGEGLGGLMLQRERRVASSWRKAVEEKA